jgi:hypothetical protein
MVVISLHPSLLGVAPAISVLRAPVRARAAPAPADAPRRAAPAPRRARARAVPRRARKRAVCIGLSYEGRSHELPGCHEDALRFGAGLKAYRGYDDVTFVLNDQATTAGITAVLRDKLGPASTSQCSEVCVFFSGHGNQVSELVRGSEEDGLDEVLITNDGFIRDDAVREILTKADPGCRVVAVFDCCTSGSVADLPAYGTRGFYGDERAAPIVCVAAAEDSKTALQVGSEGALTKHMVSSVLRKNRSIKNIHGKIFHSHQKTIVSGIGNTRGDDNLFS